MPGSHRCANKDASCFPRLSSTLEIFALPHSSFEGCSVKGTGIVVFFLSRLLDASPDAFPQLGAKMDRFSGRFSGSVHMPLDDVNVKSW
jgi:hypothetical protein